MTDAQLPPDEPALSSATEAVAPWPDFDAEEGADLGSIAITEELHVPVVPPPATIEEARRRSLDEVDAIWSGGPTAEAVDEVTDPIRAFAANVLDDSLELLVTWRTSEDFLAPFTEALTQGVEAANEAGDEPQGAVDRMTEVFADPMGRSMPSLITEALRITLSRATVDGGVPRLTEPPADDEVDRDETGQDV